MTSSQEQRLTKPTLFSRELRASAHLAATDGANRHSAFRHQPNSAHLDVRSERLAAGDARDSKGGKHD